jgi:cytochrome P450
VCLSAQRTETALPVPGGLPVIDHVLPPLRDPLGFLVSLPDRGDLVQIRIGPFFRAVVVCDPELTRQVPGLGLASWIITETLRLYPPVWMLTRRAVTDTELGGYRIPARTSIVNSSYLLHHHGGLFDDPERFDPERWDDRRTAAPHGAFIPFGGGPRRCIGDQFGMTMATLPLAAVTARWHLEPMPGHGPRPRASATFRPLGLLMHAAARPGHT